MVSTPLFTTVDAAVPGSSISDSAGPSGPSTTMMAVPPMVSTLTDSSSTLRSAATSQPSVYSYRRNSAPSSGDWCCVCLILTMS